MAKFVMMSMVFAVVLLKSAAFPLPTALSTAHLMEDGIWAIGDALKNWPANKQFVRGDTLINKIEDGITLVTGLANVTLNTAGINCFICSIADHCQLGLKLSIPVLDDTLGASPSLTPPTTTTPPTTPSSYLGDSTTPSDSTSTPGSSSPAVSVGVLVPMMAVVMGFFF